MTKKTEIRKLVWSLRKQHDGIEARLMNEANPDELLADLSFTVRILIDITEIMLQEEDEEVEDG